MKQVDVLVIGAGSAGCAASVAGASNGCSVMCVDRLAYPGGIATASMVGTICGTFFRGPTCRWCVGGFAKHFSEAVAEASGTQPMTYGEHLWFIPYEPECFKAVSERMMQEAGVEFCPTTNLAGFNVVADGCVELQVQHAVTKDDTWIRAACIIDCSGGAALSLGSDMLLERQAQQTGALVCRVKGLRGADTRTISLQVVMTILRGIHDGNLPESLNRLSVVPGLLKEGEGLLKLGLRSHTTREAACTLLKQGVKYLRSVGEPFQQLEVQEVADEVGERSGVCYQGEAILLAADVSACAKPSDGVARGVWPGEFWGESPQPRMDYFPEDDAYLIPVGCLQSGDHPWLMFAGKNISAEDNALGSARVMGTCMQTGFAAGMLAAGRISGQPVPATIRKIRRQQLDL